MAFVAIGGNLPGREGVSSLQTCMHAIERMESITGIRTLAVSRWYETVPQPPSGQPNYINGVVHLECGLSPERLLADLQVIEHEAGRVRTEQNAARTLDLDIIAMGSTVRRPPQADPVLPHPRMHLRAFVLAPLVDVAPTWMHPTLMKPAAELLAELPDQGVRPLTEADIRSQLR